MLPQAESGSRLTALFEALAIDHDPLNPPPPDRGNNPTVNWHKRNARTKRTNRCRHPDGSR